MMKKKNRNEVVRQRKKGILIVFEGISGSGKSEGIRRLTRHLSSLGISSTVVEWNTNRAIRGVVDRLNRLGLLTPAIYSIFQWLGFAIDYVRVIAPSLRHNRIVIADRYVYTAITRDAVNGAGRWRGRGFFRLCREPDWVLFYNASPELCWKRINLRGKALFHPNKRIHRDPEILNKELFYLTEMQKEYELLFRSMARSRDLNLIYAAETGDEIHMRIERFIYNKMGSPKPPQAQVANGST